MHEMDAQSRCSGRSASDTVLSGFSCLAQRPAQPYACSLRHHRQRAACTCAACVMPSAHAVQPTLDTQPGMPCEQGCSPSGPPPADGPVVQDGTPTDLTSAAAVHFAILLALFFSSVASTAPRWFSSFCRQSTPAQHFVVWHGSATGKPYDICSRSAGSAGFSSCCRFCRPVEASFKHGTVAAHQSRALANQCSATAHSPALAYHLGC